jgi:hypothetical protein
MMSEKVIPNTTEVSLDACLQIAGSAGRRREDETLQSDHLTTSLVGHAMHTGLVRAHNRRVLVNRTMHC